MQTIVIANGLKTTVVTVPKEWGGRDAGKKYLITELPAAHAERWGWRMFTLLESSGEVIPASVQALGYVGIARVGLNIFLRGSINNDRLFPLLDEMMTCVRIIRDPANPEIATDIGDDGIQEVRTRLWLRSEVLELHTGFSPAEALSRLLSAMTTETNSSPT